MIDDLPTPGMRRDLAPESLASIDRWLKVLEKQHGLVGNNHSLPVGLWVHGARRSGTTHVASVGTKLAVRTKDCARYGIDSWEYALTDKMAALIRDSWEEVPVKDDAAWFDALEVERKLDRLWNADLLWLDDLHTNVVNSAFVMRHLWPRLESRVKSGKATVVATSLQDRHVDDVVPVINDLFVRIEVTSAER